MPLWFVLYKTDVWNISKEKYEKLINYVFEMKELNEIALGKGLFAPIKGQRCTRKGHLGNQERHVKVKYPPQLFLPPNTHLRMHIRG